MARQQQMLLLLAACMGCLILVVSEAAAQPASTGLTCPNTTQELQGGVDLSDVASTEGVTYLLHPGTYYISRKILLDNTQVTTCYKGLASPRNRVTILLSTGISTQGSRRVKWCPAWVVQRRFRRTGHLNVHRGQRFL